MSNSKVQKLLASNFKLAKGSKLKYTSLGLSLAPANLSGKNFCPHASEGCKIACLNTAGHGVFSTVQAARIKKSQWFINNRADFLFNLNRELSNLHKRASKGEKISIRLNVLSDLPWHNLVDMPAYPALQFYDYTPNLARMIEFLEGKLPANYHLTFSRKEDNQAKVELIMSMNGNVAVVFDKLPEKYLGRKVIDGDVTDLRFLDPTPCIVGLKAKGQGRRDTSGFVIQTSK
jgi:hypothetical protein